MKIMNKLQLAAFFIGFAATTTAQDVSFTLGGETTTKLVKQSKMDNFSVGGNSYFITEYMESASMNYYVESYTDKGVARIETKLEVPVGSFNNSFGIEGVVGLGTQAYALVRNGNKSSEKKHVIPS